MYSGYLRPTEHDHVHYLFVESEYTKTDPLVLWLNGGPGASSLMGAFTELGPFIVNGEMSLMPNPFSWNKVANVLYLESPTGVGFSYCDAMVNGQPCQHNDTSTAELNFHSIMYFIEQKFPEFKGRDFMIWGESYAGVYVPTLSKLVYEAGDALDLNFLGFGVGDPCTDDKTQTFTRHLNFNFEFAMGKGFVDAENHKYIRDNCIASDVNGIITPNETTSACRAAWRMYYLGTSGGDGNGPYAKLPHGGFIDPYNSWGPNNNDFWEMLAKYLADDEVMKALNVESYPLRPWSLFADHLTYTRQYWACYFDGETPGEPYYNSSMIEIYQELAGNVRNIVVYNGDTDPSVQMRGTEAAVDAMGFDIARGGEWRPWFFQPEETSSRLLEEKLPYFGTFLNYKKINSQLGGYVKNFDGNVSFVTVHDSGHMVPQYKPVAAFHLFVRGLLNKPLSPPINMTEVADLSDAAFYGSANSDAMGMMGDWVEEAMSKEYTSSGEYEARKGERKVSEGAKEKPSYASRKVMRPKPPRKFAPRPELDSLKKHEVKELLKDLQGYYEAM
ncbi:carboxypeptidase [Chloropicon primus]|uniref:Carboxypeptidase n=1 Tax=Chloropicon primus TaxID=1764295 RepID=A0A5B8MMN4_9CHLO|nr:carboxypeptidase [Chloropicon primus]UPR01036.1 carboxypeptidase [Chloropicon primus]|eukprot:QDZ21816.1 carboxypeptidase [Chloropicon primus]